MARAVTGLESAMREINRIVDKEITSVMNEVHLTARAKTPVKTGNAKRNWRKQQDDRGFEVKNTVPYIERLEAGSSRQAPRGIVGPTLTEIKRRNV